MLTQTAFIVCEDLHTSYWDDYQGGFQRRGTFIEYSKNFIDWINAWHSREPKKLDVSNFTRATHSLHYYDEHLGHRKTRHDGAVGSR